MRLAAHIFTDAVKAGKERKKAMYQKVDTNLNVVDREKETEKFWRENDIFKKSMENRKIAYG